MRAIRAQKHLGQTIASAVHMTFSRQHHHVYGIPTQRRGMAHQQLGKRYCGPNGYFPIISWDGDKKLLQAGSSISLTSLTWLDSSEKTISSWPFISPRKVKKPFSNSTLRAWIVISGLVAIPIRSANTILYLFIKTKRR